MDFWIWNWVKTRLSLWDIPCILHFVWRSLHFPYNCLHFQVIVEYCSFCCKPKVHFLSNFSSCIFTSLLEVFKNHLPYFKKQYSILIILEYYSLTLGSAFFPFVPQLRWIKKQPIVDVNQQDQSYYPIWLSHTLPSPGLCLLNFYFPSGRLDRSHGGHPSAFWHWVFFLEPFSVST